MFNFEANSTDSTYIEVYKFPKDSWSSQIDTVIDRINHQKKVKDDVSQGDQQNENAKENESSHDEIRDVFPKLNLFCKIKPPVNLIKPQRNFIQFFIS